MLLIYVDDSGTHSKSNVVLLAGAMAFPNQWDLFSDKWRQKLESPSPGKLPLYRFHMFDCQHAINEFAGWSRVATDFLVKELVDISKSVMIRAHVCAVLRTDWDELVNGDMRRVFGDAEGFCIKMMYTRCLKMAQQYFSAKEVAFVFDDTPERAKENNLVYQLFQTYYQDTREPSPVSLSFGSSHIPSFADRGYYRVGAISTFRADLEDRK